MNPALLVLYLIVFLLWLFAMVYLAWLLDND